MVNIYNIKFTTLTVVSAQVNSIKDIHTVTQPSPPSVSRTFWFSKLKLWITFISHGWESSHSAL